MLNKKKKVFNKSDDTQNNENVKYDRNVNDEKRKNRKTRCKKSSVPMEDDQLL